MMTAARLTSRGQSSDSATPSTYSECPVTSLSRRPFHAGGMASVSLWGRRSTRLNAVRDSLRPQLKQMAGAVESVGWVEQRA
jgi:hypothetical protein